jgi:hypothetical protein
LAMSEQCFTKHDGIADKTANINGGLRQFMTNHCKKGSLLRKVEPTVSIPPTMKTPPKTAGVTQSTPVTARTHQALTPLSKPRLVSVATQSPDMSSWRQPSEMENTFGLNQTVPPRSPLSFSTPKGTQNATASVFGTPIGNVSVPISPIVPAAAPKTELQRKTPTVPSASLQKIAPHTAQSIGALPPKTDTTTPVASIQETKPLAPLFGVPTPTSTPAASAAALQPAL